MSRPHWLPEIVWMGIKIGEWPIETFGTEQQAQKWASGGEYGERERRIWSVAIPEDTVVYKVETIPASTRSEQVYP